MICSAKLAIAAHNHGAERNDFCAESSRILIIIRALFQVVKFDVLRRQVGIVDAQAAVLRLIIDMIAIHQRTRRHLIGRRKVFVAIKLIIVSLYLAAKQKMEEVSKEIDASILRGRRII